MKAINVSKVKLDKDVIDLDAKPSDYDPVKRKYDALIDLFRGKVKSIQEADKSQSLYSLNKPVKETAVYPATFSGRGSENIFKFKEKFLNALETNQVREQDKFEVLRKHLKGYAKESIDDDTDVTSLKEVFLILEKAYGNTRDTWDATVKDFEKKMK